MLIHFALQNRAFVPGNLYIQVNLARCYHVQAEQMTEDRMNFDSNSRLLLTGTAVGFSHRH